MLLNASKRIEKLVSEVANTPNGSFVAIKGVSLGLTIDSSAQKKRGPFSDIRPCLISGELESNRKVVIALTFWELGRKLTDLMEWLSMGPREFESYLRDRNDWEIKELSEIDASELDEVKQQLLLSLFKLKVPMSFYVDHAQELTEKAKQYGRLVLVQSLLKLILEASTSLFGIKAHLVNVRGADELEVLAQFFGEKQKAPALIEKVMASAIEEISHSGLFSEEFLSFLPMKTSIKVVAE